MTVPAPFTTLTLTRGATVYEVDIHAAHRLTHVDDPIPNWEILRAIDGRAILQVRHPQRRRIVQFSGEGSCPPEFEALGLPGEFTLDCPTLPAAPLTVIVLPPSETADAHGAVISWSLTCEEA